MDERRVAGRSELDAKRSFAALSGSRDRDIRKKFDYWLAGGPPIDRWFHGWPNDSECRECFYITDSMAFFTIRSQGRTQHSRFVCLYTMTTKPNGKQIAGF